MHDFDPNAAAGADAGIFGLPHSVDQAKVVLIPVPFDATTSYRAGTAQGPAAILRASHQVDLFDLELGRPYEPGITMLPIPKEIVDYNAQARHLAERIIAVGGVIGEDVGLHADLAEVNALSQKMTDWVKAQTTHYIKQGKLVGIVGGDHSTPLGTIMAHAEHYGEFGILHIDAHADLRVAYEGFEQSHASIMNNVMSKVPQVTRLVQVGIRDICDEEIEMIRNSNERIQLFDMPGLQSALHEGQTWVSCAQRMIHSLPQQVYISFDIDGLDPSLCPHTGTPVPEGLLFYQVSRLFKELVVSGRKIIGFDLNEVAPGPDENDEWDGNVGARVLYKMIGYALQSHR